MQALAKIHIGKKALGLDDDTYRAMLHRLTGHESAKALTAAQMVRVLEEMKRNGAFAKPLKGTRRPLEGQYAKKLQALWIAGWNLGVIKNKDDKALIAFVSRQTGLSHTRFLRYADDARRAIEALKGWIAREAGISWGDGAKTAEDFALRILFRQWNILRAAGVKSVKTGNLILLISDNFADQIRFAGRAPMREQWHRLMNNLGQAVRGVKNGTT
ncbi:regulatory protein GemA [Candidatus Tokpelaia sp.]|uniref:regulatory protein GemA n=1 Tax=Candidatus Tokpelaia sp. TaxID=2233777 RepID=UPI001238AF61|nr:regulatory protein GemA [Candidatus Tokpelaia sp.]KAA6405046.1 GemA protein [Candidatus Tokpelaia sp.]